MIFLNTGQDDIDVACDNLERRVALLGSLAKELLVLPSYGALPPTLQKRIFEPAPKNTRKVVQLDGNPSACLHACRRLIQIKFIGNRFNEHRGDFFDHSRRQLRRGLGLYEAKNVLLENGRGRLNHNADQSGIQNRNEEEMID